MAFLNTRVRIMVLTVLVAIVHIVLQRVNLPAKLNLSIEVDLVAPLIIAFIGYIGTYWALFFKIKGERFVTILLFPAISLFALSLLTEFLVASVFGGFGVLTILFVSTLIHLLFTYLTLLTVNLLNTAYLKDIPLGQAARAAQFVLTLIIGYVYYFIFFSNSMPVTLRCLAVGVISWLLVYIALWSINLRRRQRSLASTNIALLTVFATLVLSIWPVNAPYLALVLSLVLYINLGIALEIREIISKWIMIEYISLFLMMLVLLLVVAKWGINGYILSF